MTLHRGRWVGIPAILGMAGRGAGGCAARLDEGGPPGQMVMRCRGGGEASGREATMTEQDELEALERLLRESARDMRSSGGGATSSGMWDGPHSGVNGREDDSATVEASEWEKGGAGYPHGVWIRRASVMDVTDMQHINLVCLPENYQARYFWYHIMRWPELALVAEEEVKGDKVGPAHLPLPPCIFVFPFEQTIHPHAPAVSSSSRCHGASPHASRGASGREGPARG